MSHLYIAKDTKDAKKLSRLFKQQKLRRIYRGIYTSELTEPLEQIIKRHWMEIVTYIVPQGILSFRTAVDLKPIPFKKHSIVFVTSRYEKSITLPGLIIKVVKGNNDEYLEQVLPNLGRSNVPRFLLENLKTIRSTEYRGIKTIAVEGIEKYLAKEMRARGEIRLNQIRDEAKGVAKALNYIKEYKQLDQIISALLSTHPDAHTLKTKIGNAFAKNQPYDIGRLKSFETFSLYLTKCNFKQRSYTYNKLSYKNIAFFESYFSNFIEGTEFLIDEAEDIVFKGHEVNNRHADSHDILANFNLANDYSEMTHTPQNAKEFLDSLLSRHAYLMKERPEKNPGQFKHIPNRAGNTYFVDPKDVIGTLVQGFEIYQLLEAGLKKALFMHFMITEVHPFLDGNGRLARIMMNAELVSAMQHKIIIPTVHRDNYLNGLRLATRDQNFLTYCKVMDQAQAYIETINWLDYSEAREKFESDAADKTSDEGLPIFNRALRKLSLSEFD